MKGYAPPAVVTPRHERRPELLFSEVRDVEGRLAEADLRETRDQRIVDVQLCLMDRAS